MLVYGCCLSFVQILFPCSSKYSFHIHFPCGNFQTFQMLDEKKDGTVTENKFQRVIKTFCPAFTDDHFGHLLLKVTPRIFEPSTLCSSSCHYLNYAKECPF